MKKLNLSLLLCLMFFSVFSQLTDNILDSRDGLVYKIVKIGNQWWMAENLKATKYNDGTDIPLVTDNTAWTNLTSPGYCWYNNDETAYKTLYGALYNFYTIETTSNGNKNICPSGWHVPDEIEFEILLQYLYNNNYQWEDSVFNYEVAKSLAATYGWEISDIPGRVGNDQESNNRTGFTALPSGGRPYGVFNRIGGIGLWWLNPISELDIYRIFIIRSHYSYVEIEVSDFTNGYSVRCIKDPCFPEGIAFSKTDVTCHGSSDGSISLEVNGGKTPFRYLWSTGDTTQNLTDISSGNYWIQVTDANNCTISDTIDINEPSPINVEINVDSILCAGGCVPVNIIISGGTVPYEWEITPSPIDTCLKAGKYTLVIHDHNNCSVEEAFTVYEPSPILIDLEVTNTCFNDSTGKITSDVTGGTLPYKYLWNNGKTTPDLTNLPEGIYLLTITDNNDCIATATDTVNEFPEVQKVQIIGYTIVNPAEIYIYSVSQKTGSVFNWIITGGNIVSGQGTNSINVQWGLPGNGKIAVIETDENLCPGDFVSLSVEISTGYSSPSMEQIRIFPNPFSNKAVIQFPNSQNYSYDLIITDLTGKVVRVVGKITENSYELNKDGLPAGLYLIELRGHDIYRGKIIIE